MALRRSPCPMSFLLVLLTLLLAAPPQVEAASPQDFPVVATGADLAAFDGAATDTLYAFVYDSGSSSWTRIPAQVDERIVRSLRTCANQGTNIDDHLSYVFEGEPSEGNGLDADDEVVFMAFDAGGDPAPTSAWLAGTDPVRYELAVDDGQGGTLGTVYLYTASAPPAPDPGADYSNLDFNWPLPGDPTGILEDTTISGDLYEVHFSARWRQDELRVLSAGGGSGADLVDRLKWRAGGQDDGTGGETEEIWDEFSCHLGHKDGPVRVLREIQGAASGVNTTHTQSYYRDLWVSRVNLRVHAIDRIMFFNDFDSARAVPGPLTYYDSNNPGGAAVNGVMDENLTQVLPDWLLVTHATDGAVFEHLARPVPPTVQNESLFWWDDANFVDDTGDDEPGRYGCPGIFLYGVSDTDAPGNEAVFVHTFRPLPAGTGNIGATLAGEVESPPSTVPVAQAHPSLCGNGTCDPGETGCSCGTDCGSPPSSEVPAATCQDGIDNDCDGPADCQDTDCGSDEACAFCGNGICNAEEDPCTCAQDCGAPPAFETDCSNGEDDDCDTLVDLADPDCCLDPGESCTLDSQCCSNKCKGKQGSRTCR